MKIVGSGLFGVNCDFECFITQTLNLLSRVLHDQHELAFGYHHQRRSFRTTIQIVGVSRLDVTTIVILNVLGSLSKIKKAERFTYRN